MHANKNDIIWLDARMRLSRRKKDRARKGMNEWRRRRKSRVMKHDFSLLITWWNFLRLTVMRSCSREIWDRVEFLRKSKVFYLGNGNWCGKVVGNLRHFEWEFEVFWGRTWVELKILEFYEVSRWVQLEIGRNFQRFFWFSTNFP